MSVEVTFTTCKGYSLLTEIRDWHFLGKWTQVKGIDVVVHNLFFYTFVDPAMRNYFSTEFVLLKFTIMSPHFLVKSVLKDHIVGFCTSTDYMTTILNDLLP